MGGVFDKAKEKLEQLVGDAEDKVGEKLGHGDIEPARKRDQSSGEAEEVGHDLPDKPAEDEVSDHDEPVEGEVSDHGKPAEDEE
jgi:uncharacterized protein YjbJ (UPF0337 family)